ncbi:MAG: hypothetical protein KAS32_24870 [Candidatus Peribacteraceae bacterium]|nr:hypothetical protein [Candidatus Peribacteraceae bacterium]
MRFEHNGYICIVLMNQWTITEPDGTEQIYHGYTGETAWFDIVKPGWIDRTHMQYLVYGDHARALVQFRNSDY